MDFARDCGGSLLIKATAPKEGYTKIAGRGYKGLIHSDFGLLRLSSGGWSSETGDCEYGLTIFSGVVSVQINAASGAVEYRNIGSRKSAFDGLPTAVYIPPQASFTVSTVQGPVEIAVFAAETPGYKAEPMLIGPAETIVADVGKDNWRRDVWTSIGTNVPAAKLLIGETLTPSGNWSSYPPHKHDTPKPPVEAVLEEVYYFQVHPKQGYGLIRVYTDDEDPCKINEIYVVEDGDTVIIPRGYHPVTAAPGYQVHYTWELAGDERRYGAWADDPKHAWLRNA